MQSDIDSKIQEDPLETLQSLSEQISTAKARQIALQDSVKAYQENNLHLQTKLATVTQNNARTKEEIMKKYKQIVQDKTENYKDKLGDIKEQLVHKE